MTWIAGNISHKTNTIIKMFQDSLPYSEEQFKNALFSLLKSASKASASFKSITDQQINEYVAKYMKKIIEKKNCFLIICHAY